VRRGSSREFGVSRAVTADQVRVRVRGEIDLAVWSVLTVEFCDPVKQGPSASRKNTRSTKLGIERRGQV
jgi:hypothetical protein